jgi:hypothetical protein
VQKQVVQKLYFASGSTEDRQDAPPVICYGFMVDQEAAVRTKFLALRPVLDERLSRLWAGAEAEALGDGGIAIVERATGLSRTTIRAGRDELRAGVSAEDVMLVRRAGGGRPRIEATTPEIVAVLESLVDPVTRGDPEHRAA